MEKKSLRTFFGQLCLADKFLLGFMAVVMVYLTLNLFFEWWSSAASSNIDVMVRTTGASIFGYFIGGSFIHQTLPPADTKKKPSVTASSLETAGNRQKEITPENKKNYYVRQQILIIGAIGMFALVLLMALPAEKVQSPSSIAAVSQLRDFVSGSVGLLIGHSTRGKG